VASASFSGRGGTRPAVRTGGPETWPGPPTADGWRLAARLQIMRFLASGW
jgi:hypothetical protein